MDQLTKVQIDHVYARQVIWGEPTRAEDGIELKLSFVGGGWMPNSGICFHSAKAEVSIK